MRSVQSKDEITAHSKTNQQSLTNAETWMVCVVTKTFGEQTVRQKSLADVEEMVSEFFRSIEVMDCKLNGECITMSSECEERQRF